MKLIDLSPAIYAIAGVIVNTVTTYLEQTASPACGFKKLVRTFSDGAFVML